MNSVLSELVKPAGWDQVPFGRLVTRSKEAGQPEASSLSVFLDQGVVPRSSREDNFNRLGEDLSKYLVVRPGDVVFNKLRTWQGGFGVSKYKGIVSPAYFVCRPGPRAEPRFLHYLLRSHPYLSELTRISKFMPPSQFDILWDDLRLVSVLLPPPAEQRAIADFLDAETARIDALITKKQRLLKLLGQREDRLVDDMMTADGRGTEVRLARVAQLQGGLTIDASREDEEGTRGYPYLRVANVQPGRLDLREVKEVRVPPALAKRCLLRPGDVLMTEGGDIDKLGRGTVWRGEISNCLHQNHVFAVRPNKARLLSEFLALYTRSSAVRSYFERTGVQSTNLASTSSSKVLALPVPTASVHQQREILETFKAASAQIAGLSALLGRQITLLQEHRQALITASVTGELDIPGAAA